MNTIRNFGLGILIYFSILNIPSSIFAYTVSKEVSTASCQLAEFSDLDRNGDVDQMRLKCDFRNAGSLNDTILVIDQNNDMLPITNWQEAGDFTHDTWIFDYTSDSKAELLIQFQTQEQTVSAKVYDIPEGNDRIIYTFSQGHLTLSQPSSPSIIIVSKDGWWVRENQINYNLDITVDDKIFAIHEADRVLELINRDGKRDFSIVTRDTNNDGRPDYDWRTVFFQEQPRFPFVRTYLTVNTGQDEAPIEARFPWPYIGNVTFGYTINSPHSSMPAPIQVDWASGQIRYIGEFVSSRGNDNQWFMYSFEEVKPQQLTNTNFENPFAWYDLAADDDRSSELAIRFEYYPSNDPMFLFGDFPRPINNIRYSWDQDNDGFWDYKLGLLGNYAVDSIVKLDDLQMRMMPYDTLPEWITSHSWGVGIFVAADSVQAMGEGIYEWDAPAWLAKGYFAGYENSFLPPVSDEPLTTANTKFQQILPGYRGEYQENFNRQPYLYLSPIDQKLHLVGARKGIWNVDNYSHMYYQDLNQDNYFDEWELIAMGSLQGKLNLAQDFLIYSSVDSITLKKVKIPARQFEILPPANSAEWRLMNERIPRDKKLLHSTSLISMLEQFNGQTLTIQGARLHDFRHTADGFRFVLELPAGFQAPDSDILNLKGLQAGSYVVIYDGQFRVELLTPPDLSAVLTPSTFVQNNAGTLTFSLHNAGLQDAPDATLELWAAPADTDATMVLSKTLDLLAQETITTTLSWAPSYAGNWSVTHKIRQPNGSVTESGSRLIQVQPAPSTTPTSLIQVGGISALLPFIAMLLVGFAVLGGGVIWHHTSRSVNQGHQL